MKKATSLDDDSPSSSPKKNAMSRSEKGESKEVDMQFKKPRGGTAKKRKIAQSTRDAVTSRARSIEEVLTRSITHQAIPLQPLP